MGVVLPFSLVLGELAGRLPIGIGRAILPLMVVLIVRHGGGAGARQRVYGFIALCFTRPPPTLPPRWLIKTRQPQHPFQEHTHGALLLLLLLLVLVGGRKSCLACVCVQWNWVVSVIIIIEQRYLGQTQAFDQKPAGSTPAPGQAPVKCAFEQCME